MKKLISFILPALMLFFTGCTTTGDYLTDRGRDLADIATVGVGGGLGAKVRIGPLQTGLLADVPLASFRGGQPALGAEGSILPDTLDLQGVIVGVETFRHSRNNRLARLRGKQFIAEGKHIPFVSRADPPRGQMGPGYTFIEYPDPLPGCPSYYTQLEAVAGFLGSVRLGLNPGELADFVVGWAKIDLFNDDVGILKLSEERTATELYEGDGTLIDHGRKAAMNRYILNLGQVDLGKSASMSYRMENLPIANLVPGLVLRDMPPLLPDGGDNEAYRKIQVRIALKTADGKTIFEKDLPLSDWTWSGNMHGTQRFVYVRGMPRFEPEPYQAYVLSLSIDPQPGSEVVNTAELQLRGGGWKAL